MWGTLGRLAFLALAAAFVTACLAGGEQQAGGMTVPMSANEVEAEVARVRLVTPLPPGAAWTPLQIDDRGSYGPYAGGSLVEWQAFCAWVRERIDAQGATQQERASQAVAVLMRARSWRTFSDPSLAPGSTQELIGHVVDDATTGRINALRDFSKANCP
jgi:hypothetical protein